MKLTDKRILVQCMMKFPNYFVSFSSCDSRFAILDSMAAKLAFAVARWEVSSSVSFDFSSFTWRSIKSRPFSSLAT